MHNNGSEIKRTQVDDILKNAIFDQR